MIYVAMAINHSVQEYLMISLSCCHRSSARQAGSARIANLPHGRSFCTMSAVEDELVGRILPQIQPLADTVHFKYSFIY